MVEIKTNIVYEAIEGYEIATYFSGDGFNDPLYWDFLIKKYLPKYKE